MDVAEILAEAIGNEDDVKLELLSKTMYLEDQEKAKVKFREILSSLSPDLVRMKTYNLYVWSSMVCAGGQNFCQRIWQRSPGRHHRKQNRLYSYFT